MKCLNCGALSPPVSLLRVSPKGEAFLGVCELCEPLEDWENRDLAELVETLSKRREA